MDAKMWHQQVLPTAKAVLAPGCKSDLCLVHIYKYVYIYIHQSKIYTHLSPLAPLVRERHYLIVNTESPRVRPIRQSHNNFSICTAPHFHIYAYKHSQHLPALHKDYGNFWPCTSRGYSSIVHSNDQAPLILSSSAPIMAYGINAKSQITLRYSGKHRHGNCRRWVHLYEICARSLVNLAYHVGLWKSRLQQGFCQFGFCMINQLCQPKSRKGKPMTMTLFQIWSMAKAHFALQLHLLEREKCSKEKHSGTAEPSSGNFKNQRWKWAKCKTAKDCLNREIGNMSGTISAGSSVLRHWGHLPGIL